ncbi:hypothetical protein LZ017_16325 [Pelomonas sp. CA6]|uniref:hypothetical protein n=1 Tax=Pelomonas sp. CA6 TaxID=2907999 RepID=UPI001F4C325C|nr:hypothetical protein [Pelomonas sp. CA6]MCH7344948.1 hypothetical protein [Pelomonas sp. CA6]
MRPSLLKLPGWQKRWLYGSFGVLLATGTAWLLLHYGREADALPSASEAWLLRTHGLASLLGLLSLGMVIGSHVPAGWRLSAHAARRRQRRSGLWLGGFAAVAVLSAYALLYLLPESWHEGTGWLHAGLAAGLPLLWLWHRPRR